MTAQKLTWGGGCWDSSEYDFDWVDSVGKSGGILSIWNNQVFKKSEVIKARHFLIVIGRWVGIEESVAFANIYGPQAVTDKEKLWEEVLEIKNSKAGKWVVFGDFNAVRRPDERFNSRYCSRTAMSFNRFIRDADLHEFNMGGHKFTFFCSTGAKLSKLDRFLVCPGFLNSFSRAVVTALPRELSDHCPVTLISQWDDFGPRPFKFFNSWLLKDGIQETVTRAWGHFKGYGNPDRYLLAKLKFLKVGIRKWRSEANKVELKEISSYRDLVQKLDFIAESRSLSEDELKVLHIGRLKIKEFERTKIMDLKQKARVKWAVEGDENSQFFHGHINNRNRRSRINGLTINGKWTTEVSQIKEEVFRFYCDKFNERWPSRPKLVNHQFRRLPSDVALSIEEPFTEVEIRVAVWACGGDRAPGPDGFTFRFIKQFWEILKGDFMACVRYFEEFGVLAAGCNSSFITLVPKIKDPSILSDYRPISLVGCIYKVLAKALALRLKSVIALVIDEVQSAYIEGRNILDGPLIVNEICTWSKRSKREVLLLKVDFDKAFDSVNWEYLDSVLMQMGFGLKWRLWMKGCLSSSRASVLVNGSPTKEFSMSRGVRQGDPLSPFLFIIAMEGLNVAMKAARDKGLYTGIHIPNSDCVISHLFYADDAIFVGEWSRRNIKNLARILRCFHVSSGLKVNFHKSKLFGLRSNPQETIRWSNVLGCEAGTLPFKYLGVTVGANMKLSKNWKPLIDRFRSKLSDWKAKTLSFGGRLTLIKSVLGNLPTYYLSLFKAPKGVLSELERLRRRFLWGGGESSKKIHWVSWKSITAPKENGGLGVGSLRALNIALLSKWWWRLKTDKSTMWCKVITGFHNLANKPADHLSRTGCVGVWRDIVSAKTDLLEVGISFQEILTKVVGSGQETFFWLDEWCGGGKLKDQFPSLYKLEKSKKCLVADRLKESGEVWEWRHNIINPELLDELNRMRSIIGSFCSNGGRDRWKCGLANDGEFSVAAVRRCMDGANMSTSTLKVRWLKEVPIKVNCFIWRASMGRIPTAQSLIHRGIKLNSPICSLCKEELECADHALVKCALARKVKKEIMDWCGIGDRPVNSISELLDFADSWSISLEKTKMLQVICVSMLWCIWKSRNDWCLIVI